MRRIEIYREGSLYRILVVDYKNHSQREYECSYMRYSSEYNLVILYKDNHKAGTISLEDPRDRVLWDPEEVDTSIKTAIEGLIRGW